MIARGAIIRWLCCHYYFFGHSKLTGFSGGLRVPWWLTRLEHGMGSSMSQALLVDKSSHAKMPDSLRSQICACGPKISYLCISINNVLIDQYHSSMYGKRAGTTCETLISCLLSFNYGIVSDNGGKGLGVPNHDFVCNNTTHFPAKENTLASLWPLSCYSRTYAMVKTGLCTEFVPSYHTAKQ